jgi:succinate-semialdehyde dehydrogenase/glutarate-semialdehyde dehydrogenase
MSGTIQSVNPATGRPIKAYPETSPEEIARLLDRSGQAFQRWRATPFSERAALLRGASKELRGRVEPLAALMAQEMGKPLAQGRSEVEKCAWVCDYYAEQAEGFLRPEPVKTDASKSFVAFEPLGPVLAVMPWNFPFWQVFRFAAPALMAGNTGILKHASNVPGCALAIEEIFRAAGAPEGLFRTVLGGSERVAQIIEHPNVAAVTLTGSTGAGKAIASKAGAALKKSVLELGGSDPYLVLADADLAAAAETCANSRLINSGQSCIAAKRFIVEAPVREQFERLFVEQMRSKPMGDPMQEGTVIGPLARHDLRDGLHGQVQRSVAAGANVLLGGAIPSSPGAYYPATVLTDVRKGMPAYDEELFGPVAAVIAARDEAEAVRIANDSVFGLGAAVFTRDNARGEAVAQRLQAGSCFVNASVRSDPRLPFGGIKESGYGRELSSFGIREFVNVKTVYIK